MNIMIERLFYNKYINFRNEQGALSHIYSSYYDNFVNYYDASRAKVNKLNTIKDKVLYTLMYNISSSAMSFLKTLLLNTAGPSEALMIRNMIESVLYYILLFESNIDKKFYEVFFYHHYVYEYNFVNEFHMEHFKEDLKEALVQRRNLAIQHFSKVHEVNIEKAEKILRMRNGWTYCIKGTKPLSTSKIADYVGEEFLLDILQNHKLNEAIHIDSYNVEIPHETLTYLFAYSLTILMRLNDITNLKVKSKSMFQLRKEYSQNIIENKIAPKYEWMYKAINQSKLYKEITKQNLKIDPLKDLFDADNRFGFECQAYAAGYSYVFEKQLELIKTIDGVLERYGTIDVRERVSRLTHVFVIMSTDFAFGFENEYKIKFRYFVEQLIYAFFKRKTNRGFEKFILDELRKLDISDANLNFATSLYHESCNFVHPSVYGYLGHFSMDLEYTFEYVFVASNLLRVCLFTYLKGIPLTTQIYNQILESYKECEKAINNRTQFASKYLGFL